MALSYCAVAVPRAAVHSESQKSSKRLSGDVGAEKWRIKKRKAIETKWGKMGKQKNKI